MADETTTAIVPAEYRELGPTDVVRGREVIAVSSAPTLWQPIPVPAEWLDDEGNRYQPDWKKLKAKTPKHEIKVHPKGFRYTTVDYARKRLNEVFGHGRWIFSVVRWDVNPESYEQVTRRGEHKNYKEVIVEGYIMAPGLAGPVYGIGSAPWSQDDQGDPRFFLATARASAESIALKSAAKKIGIGADIKDDEESNRIVSGQRTTCVTMFNQLMGDGKKAEALKVAKKLASVALVGETLDPERIDEDALDDLLSALTAAVIG